MPAGESDRRAWRSASGEPQPRGVCATKSCGLRCWRHESSPREEANAEVLQTIGAEMLYRPLYTYHAFVRQQVHVPGCSS